MKKYTALLAFSAVLVTLLASCSSETYQDGYEAGYTDGYAEAHQKCEYLCEEEFFEGYEMGYDDGGDDVRVAIDDALDYAREQTGWSVYEAWSNISIYNDGVHPYGYAIPTEEEYRQSIETLVIFCKYLDNAGLCG